MKNLADLQAECSDLGITVKTTGRPSKEPYVATLRNHPWRKDHSDEPLPAQIMPMLLSSWEDLDKAEQAEIEQDCYAWIVQPKLDGVRVLLHVEDDRVRITSRTVSEITYRLSEFQDNLPHLTEGLAALSGSILDGELVYPLTAINTGSTITGTSLQATMAILATTPENARRIQERDAEVRFHVFDILRHCGQDVASLSLMDRQHFLEKSSQQMNNPFIEMVPSFVVNKSDIHRRLIDVGGEGSVWKKADQPYESGRRVRHWLKRKRGIEVEAFVTGFKRGTNGHAGLVGAVEFGIRKNGSVVPIAWVTGWTDEDRLRMTQADSSGNVSLAPDYLGRRAVIFGQELSAKSYRIRHARIKRWLS